MADILEARRRERDRLIEVARGYVEGLARRHPIVAAAVVGSVARGDFNVWSDVDVIVVAEDLPARAPRPGHPPCRSRSRRCSGRGVHWR